MFFFLTSFIFSCLLLTLFQYPQGFKKRIIHALICTSILCGCMQLNANDIHTFKEVYRVSYDDDDDDEITRLTATERDIYFKRCQFYTLLSMRYKNHAREIWDATPTVEGTELFIALMSSYIASKTVTDLRAKAVTAFTSFSTFILTKATYQIKHLVDNYKLMMIYIRESYTNAYWAYIYQEALFKNCTFARAIYEDNENAYLRFEKWEVCQ